MTSPLDHTTTLLFASFLFCSQLPSFLHAHTRALSPLLLSCSHPFAYTQKMHSTIPAGNSNNSYDGYNDVALPPPLLPLFQSAFALFSQNKPTSPLSPLNSRKKTSSISTMASSLLSSYIATTAAATTTTTTTKTKTSTMTETMTISSHCRRAPRWQILTPVLQPLQHQRLFTHRYRIQLSLLDCAGKKGSTTITTCFLAFSNTQQHNHQQLSITTVT